MAKIATIYSPFFEAPLEPYTMDMVRWLRISQAFARNGHKIDVIVPGHPRNQKNGQKALLFIYQELNGGQQSHHVRKYSGEPV